MCYVDFVWFLFGDCGLVVFYVGCVCGGVVFGDEWIVLRGIFMSWYVVGLIGGIVVGKSEVIWCFEVLGIVVVDVDLVVCVVVVVGSFVLGCIVECFGVGML